MTPGGSELKTPLGRHALAPTFKMLEAGITGSSGKVHERQLWEVLTDYPSVWLVLAPRRQLAHKEATPKTRRALPQGAPGRVQFVIDPCRLERVVHLYGQRLRSFYGYLEKIP